MLSSLGHSIEVILVVLKLMMLIILLMVKIFCFIGEIALSFSSQS